MSKKWLLTLLIVAAIIGIAGAALSVGMLISAVKFGEWGRVILYGFTTAVCIEMTVLSICKLKNWEST